MADRPIRLALLGCGTVGAGVARLLTRNADHLRRQSGRSFEIVWALVRDAERPRPDLPATCRVVADAEAVLADDSIDIAVEVMGGVEPAFGLCSRLLAGGRHLVTANKALLAERGPALCRVAHEHDRAICFEAAVAGGIPIVAPVAETLAANRITSLGGILNGTCNYVLTAMHDRGLDYAAALAEAQAKGFAEADPTLDVDGTDTAQKLAILCRLAFQSVVRWQDVPRRGIDRIDALDVRQAGSLGFAIKCLGRAQVAADGTLGVSVGPTLVPEAYPMGQVRWEYNAVEVVGDAVGDVFHSGKGAGMMPTASSVVAGILDLAIGRGQETFRTLRLWDENPPGPRLGAAAAPCRHYLRYAIADRPGQLARIARTLGQRGVSIASVVQHPGSGDASEGVPLVITTHAADPAAVCGAVSDAQKAGLSLNEPVCLPVAE